MNQEVVVVMMLIRLESSPLIKRRREIHSWNEQEIRGNRSLSTTAYTIEQGNFRTPTMMSGGGGYRNSLRLMTSPMSPRFSLKMTGSRGLVPSWYYNTTSGGGIPSQQTSTGIPRNIGTQIDEGHQNFVLMYDMLMGIRTTVSRCNAKMNRELTLEDFKARHKLAFDV